jgi:isoleucyl-tRNA synthetase
MSKSLGNVTAPQEVWNKYGADILRLWAMVSDTADDLRLGPEILKQQAELYRRLRNTLRWLLGSLAGFTPSEHLPEAEMPELERWVLHRLWELDGQLREAVESHDWTGVYPAIHAFCATDLSAFYFDIRKDALYCDRPDSMRRRAARAVLDHLHRCLTTWLAPVLVFTAEEAWTARFGEDASVHLQDFYDVPAHWQDDALAARWARIRARRTVATVALEEKRRGGAIGSSLQANVLLDLEDADNLLLGASEWAEVLIVSGVGFGRAPPPGVEVKPADGEKCARCWRVLPEVGHAPGHPTLCLRCADAVASGVSYRRAAE